MTTQQQLVDALRVWQLAEDAHGRFPENADNDIAYIAAGRIMAKAIEATLREPSREREEHLRRLEQRSYIRRQAVRLQESR